MSAGFSESMNIPAQKREMIAIHWQEDVRFEGLNIRYFGFRNRTPLLAPLSGEMCDEPLYLQLPRKLTLQNPISRPRSLTISRPEATLLNRWIFND